MSKYIIEIEEEPFARRSALYGEEGLYRAKGFKSLVFDKFALDKLTPLDKELEEAYLQGKHDAEQDLARAAYDEAYQKGVNDGSLDVKLRVDGAYQKGYDAGSHEATTLEYQQGLNDAWETVRKLYNYWYGNDDIFGDETFCEFIFQHSASEVIDRIKAYEEQQKADEIKVGDEVRSNNAISDHTGVVLALSLEGNSAKVLENDGSMAWVAVNVLTKTGRHFNFLASLLNAMKEGAE